MGIFGASSAFEADIEKATDVSLVNENWTLILDVCDKLNSQPDKCKDSLKAIVKRMGHSDPHIVINAITLLDACVMNCGRPFHLEIASREFENEFKRLLAKTAAKGVSLKMRQVLKRWAENEFKDDPQLNLVPSLYAKLRDEGMDFSDLNDKPAKSAAAVKAAADALKDPNVVSSQQEQDDIAKAIELSLKEVKNSPKHSGGAAMSGGSSSNTSTAYPSLYPSFQGGSSSAATSATTTNATTHSNSTAPQPEPRKVRASYDFEAAEENELTFYTGEIIHVLDDSDPNWWRGYNERGEGLFPSNFVTADLSADPERLDKAAEEAAAAKELQQIDDAAAAASAALANQCIEIDENKIDRLLHLLHEANTEDASQDSDEVLNLEQQVHQMGPLIDAELERVDRKHMQLTKLSSDLVEAMNLYHSLMRDDVGLTSAYMGVGMAPRNMLGYGSVQMMYGMNGPGAGMSGPLSSLPYGAAAMGGNIPQMDAMSMPGQQQHGGPVPMQYQNGHVNNVLPSNLMAPHLQQHQQQPATTQQQQQQQMPATALHVMSPQHQPVPYGQQQPQHQQQQQQLPPNSNQQPPNMNLPPQQQQQQQQQPQQPQLQQGHMQSPYGVIPNGVHPNQLPPSYHHMHPQQQQQQQQHQQSPNPHQQMPLANQTHQQQQHHHHPQMNQIVPPVQTSSNDILAHLHTQMAGMSLVGGGGAATTTATAQSMPPPPMPMAMGGLGVHAVMPSVMMSTGPYTHTGFNEQKADIPIYQQQR